MTSRRQFLDTLGVSIAATTLIHRNVFATPGIPRDFGVRKFGAVGDGVVVETAALQRAIDASAQNGGGRVLIPGAKRFLTGALVLRSGVDFHLADDAMLLANPDPQNYGSHVGLLNGDGAQGLKISGTGMIDGQAMQFMTTFSERDERWDPKAFRPRMFELRRCTDLEISGITFGHSPEWGMHLLGCERVLVDGVCIRNFLEVPNCDGIDPDHCRDVEIRNCDIVCADDGIVVKTSKNDWACPIRLWVLSCKQAEKHGGEQILLIGTIDC